MILVLCERGNVRSQTAAAILRDCFGVKDVLATGYSTTTTKFLINLAEKAERVFVVGEEEPRAKIQALIPYIYCEHVNVGEDIWGLAMHPDLIHKIIKELEKRDYHHVPYYGTIEHYEQVALWRYKMALSRINESATT